MKYIFKEIIIWVFLYVTIGILLCNIMDTYATTISSFPMLLFICIRYINPVGKYHTTHKKY